MLSSAVQCSLIEENSNESSQVRGDEANEEEDDDEQEKSNDYYSCHDDKDDKEWLVSTYTVRLTSCS